MVRAVFDHAAGFEDLSRCQLGDLRRTKRLVHTAKAGGRRKSTHFGTPGIAGIFHLPP